MATNVKINAIASFVSLFMSSFLFDSFIINIVTNLSTHKSISQYKFLEASS